MATKERKRGMVVETFRDRMVVCEIRFDKQSAQFIAEHGGKSFAAPDLRGLQGQLHDYAKTYQPLTWEKVILVHIDRTDESTHANHSGIPSGEKRFHRELVFEWYVMERGTSADGRVYVREVGQAPSADADAFYGAKELYHGPSDDDVIVPYTETVHQSILSIAEAFDKLYERLRALLGTEKAVRALDTGMLLGKLLGSGQPKIERWGIAYTVNGQKDWMSVPFENPGMSRYEYDSKAEAQAALDGMRANPGEYVPDGAHVEVLP